MSELQKEKPCVARRLLKYLENNNPTGSYDDYNKVIEFLESHTKTDTKQDALEYLDMLFDSTTKSYLDKEKYQTIRDYIKSVDAKADSQADIESKNKLRKQRDAASERALIYAAKLGEAEMKIHELKIRLEMEGITDC